MRNQLERFVTRIQRRIANLEICSRRYSRARLAIFISGAFIAYAVFTRYSNLWGWVTVGLFVIAFAVVVAMHSRILSSLVRHQYYADIKREHIARINRDWSRIVFRPVPEERSDHPFARDLNLLGQRSLHHLVDTSFTREGSNLLASWLTCTNPDRAEIQSRQELVREMVSLSRFRDRLTLISAIATRERGESWQGATILKWLRNNADLGRIKFILAILVSLAVLTTALLVASILGYIGTWWMLSLTVYAAVYLTNSRLYSHLFDEAEQLYFEVNRFRPVLEYLERQNFKKGGSLEALARPIQKEVNRPSQYLKTLLRLSIAASTQKNAVIRVLLNVVCPWDLFFAYRLDQYKRRLVVRFPQWLKSINYIESAASLANYAYLNPDTSFPEIIIPVGIAKDTASFQTIGVGHPLIPFEERVVNDFDVADAGSIALITGSNMSGKSTFLRTLGVNLSLAFAGGPVSASVFRTSVFRLFTCISVADSVNDGISYFYAEVKRLRYLMDELQSDGQPPLFYLVDEIFRGTNNRERFIGSKALLLELVNYNGFGVVSTHDLELTDLQNLNSSISNYHFREHIEDGQMVFDYKLRPGPCPTTNALTIMKLEGLPVTVDETKTRNR